MLGIESVNPDDLNPWRDNPRSNEAAVDAVAASIQRFGFNVPILCDRDLRIVAGHTRWKAARKLGMRKVPVIRLDLENGEREAFSIADNRTAEIADWDLRQLRDVLQKLRSEHVPLEEVGFSPAELRQLLRAPSTQEDSLPDPPTRSDTQPGDLWALGEHRLLCGDARCPECMSRLISGRDINHVFGGPPYFNQRNYAQWDDFSSYLSDMEQIVAQCAGSLAKGAVLVWNIGHESRSHIDLLSYHSRMLHQTGLRYLGTIAWVKTSANYSVPRNMHIRRNKLYYPAFQWEALLVYQRPGDMPRMSREAVKYMQSHQTDVWSIPAVIHQAEKHGHPAVCPVEIPYRSILAYTEPGAVLLEPFGGSGTTLIAAEKAARRALVMERVPRYCDVTVQRWRAYTGKRGRRYRRKHPCTCAERQKTAWSN